MIRRGFQRRSHFVKLQFFLSDNSTTSTMSVKQLKQSAHHKQIKSMLNKAGYYNVSKIADTLQGILFYVVNGCKPHGNLQTPNIGTHKILALTLPVSYSVNCTHFYHFTFLSPLYRLPSLITDKFCTTKQELYGG